MDAPRLGPHMEEVPCNFSIGLKKGITLDNPFLKPPLPVSPRGIPERNLIGAIAAPNSFTLPCFTLVMAAKQLKGDPANGRTACVGAKLPERRGSVEQYVGGGLSKWIAPAFVDPGRGLLTLMMSVIHVVG